VPLVASLAFLQQVVLLWCGTEVLGINIGIDLFMAFNCPQKVNQPSPRSGTARLQLPRGRFQPGFSEWADDWEGFMGLGHAVRILGTPWILEARTEMVEKDGKGSAKIAFCLSVFS
jgi:hypothetical protein